RALPGARDPATTAPAAFRRILQRGLARDPAERFPTMDALLTELEGVARRRRRGLLAASVLLVGGAVATSAYVLSQREERSCDQASATVDEIWSPAHRNAIAAAF